MSTASRQEPPPVHLRVVLKLPNEEDREFSYDFKKSEISLGRDLSNDIPIPLTTVSRNHSRIFFELGDYFLEDLGSTHGTQHNGSQVEPGERRLLRDGDAIQVMSFHITFRTTARTPLDRRPGEKTEHLARRMVQEVLSSLSGRDVEPPALRVMNGPDEGLRFVFKDDVREVVFGRSPDCDYMLNDANVSRRHCLIKREWHGFTAQDLGSKNGVLINGTPAEGAQLIKDGDVIEVGGVKLTFIDPPSRLLDQMGGLAPAAPPGPGDPAESEPEPAPDPVPEDEALPEIEDSSSGLIPDASRERPDSDLGDEQPGEVLEELRKVAQASDRSVAWDVVILVLAGLFFAAAVGLVVLLLM